MPFLRLLPTDESCIQTHALPSRVQKVHGFTGTLWNADTFPAIFDQIIGSDSQAQTLFYLWTTSNHDVAIIPEGDIDQTLQHLYDNKKHGSIIDLAGLFRELIMNASPKVC